MVYQCLPTAFSNQLGWHIFFSLKRIGIGLGISLITGLLLGWLMGTFPFWNKLLDPLIYLTYPIPKLALLPLLMLFLGLGEGSKVALIITIILPQMILSIRDAIISIPETYYQVYLCMGANSFERFKQITWPAIFFGIISTLRVSLGIAFSVLFFAENYGTEYGMGYFIMDAWLRMDYPMMYAGILILSLVGLILFGCLDYLLKKKTPEINYDNKQAQR